MYIYNGREAFNMDTAKYVTFRDNGDVYIVYPDNTSYLIENYRNEVRAEEVVEKILQSYGAISCFTVPEE